MSTTSAFLVAALGLTACVAEPLDPAEGDADVAAQVVVRQPDGSRSAGPVLPVDQLFATITNATFSGTLCPEGVSSLGANDKGVFDANLGGELMSEGEGATGRCTIYFDITTPAGYQFIKPSIVWTSYLAGEGVKGKLSATYSYDLVAERKSYPIKLGIDELESSRNTPELWSPTCGNPLQRGRTRLRMDVEGSILPGEAGFLNFNGLGGMLSFEGGADWRRCRTTELVPAPVSALDGTCGGAHKQACQRGLACETSSGRFSVDPGFALGKCVSASAATARGKLDEPCGGPRRIRCDDGLTCHYRNQSLVQTNLTGVCAPTVGKEGGSCGGYPELGCGEKLGCIPGGDGSYKRCVAADGKVDDFCGQEGLAECDPGLYCTGTRCKVKKNAFPGEACGRSGDLPCSASTRCEDNICVSVR